MRALAFAVAATAVLAYAPPTAACVVPLLSQTIFEDVPADRPPGSIVLAGRLQTQGRRADAYRTRLPEDPSGGALIGLVQVPGRPWREAIPVYGVVDRWSGCYGRTDMSRLHNRSYVFVGRLASAADGRPRRFLAASLQSVNGHDPRWTDFR